MIIASFLLGNSSKNTACPTRKSPNPSFFVMYLTETLWRGQQHFLCVASSWDCVTVVPTGLVCVSWDSVCVIVCLVGVPIGSVWKWESLMSGWVKRCSFVVPVNSRGEKQRVHLRDSFLGDQIDPIYVAYNLWGNRHMSPWENCVHAPFSQSLLPTNARRTLDLDFVWLSRLHQLMHRQTHATDLLYDLYFCHIHSHSLESR